MIKKYIESFSEILINTIITNISGDILEQNDAIQKITDYFVEIKQNGNTVFLIGNGGSSGIISHASIDLLNACKIKAFPLTDNSHLTCFANDYGYENVFKEPLETLLTSNDALVAVSSSGSSKNIINAANLAKGKEAFVITFSGFNKNNPLRKIGNYNFWLNSNDYGKVEIGHSLLLHIITDVLSNQEI